MADAACMEEYGISATHQHMVERLIDDPSGLRKRDLQFLRQLGCRIQFPEGEDLSPAQKKYLEGLYDKHTLGE